MMTFVDVDHALIAFWMAVACPHGAGEDSLLDGLHICRILKPGLSEDEYNAMWREFVGSRANSLRLMALN